MRGLSALLIGLVAVASGFAPRATSSLRRSSSCVPAIRKQSEKKSPPKKPEFGANELALLFVVGTVPEIALRVPEYYKCVSAQGRGGECFDVFPLLDWLHGIGVPGV